MSKYKSFCIFAPLPSFPPISLADRVPQGQIETIGDLNCFQGIFLTFDSLSLLVEQHRSLFLEFFGCWEWGVKVDISRIEASKPCRRKILFICDAFPDNLCRNVAIEPVSLLIESYPFIKLHEIELHLEPCSIVCTDVSIGKVGKLLF
jgi:hypothetical protein